MLVFVTAVSVALVVSFLCSIFESVLLSTSPARVEALVAKRSSAGRILRDFKQHIDMPIAAILIVNTIAHTIGATVAGASYAAVFSEESLWIFSLVFTLAILLFTEIIPKTLGVTFAGRLAVPVAHSVRFLTLALQPLVIAASAVSRALRRGHKAETVSLQELRLLTAVARNEGVVGARTAGIIDGATRLHQLDAGDVLLPRPKVVFLSADMSADEARDVIRSSGHSRFPFTPTAQLDDASGIVLAKDLLLRTRDNGSVPWDDIVRAPLVIPASRPLNSLLQAFRAERQHMAIVADEYGGIDGIVTLEDIIEELVGDIVDESDRYAPHLEKLDDGSYRADGTVELRQLCATLGIAESDDEAAESDEDVHTLGGLLLTLLDRVPKEGETVVWNDYSMTVTLASKTRVVSVIIRPAGKVRAGERKGPATG